MSLTVDWEDGTAKVEANLMVVHMPIIQSAFQAQAADLVTGGDNTNDKLELLKQAADQLGVKLKLEASLFEPNGG